MIKIEHGHLNVYFIQGGLEASDGHAHEVTREELSEVMDEQPHKEQGKDADDGELEVLVGDLEAQISQNLVCNILPLLVNAVRRLKIVLDAHLELVAVIVDVFLRHRQVDTHIVLERFDMMDVLAVKCLGLGERGLPAAGSIVFVIELHVILFVFLLNFDGLAALVVRFERLVHDAQAIILTLRSQILQVLRERRVRILLLFFFLVQRTIRVVVLVDLQRLLRILIQIILFRFVELINRREVQLMLLRLPLEIHEVNLFDFKVQIAQPVVEVLDPSLFKTTELVILFVDGAKDQWAFEFALVYFELRVAHRKHAPCDTIIFRDGRTFEQDELELQYSRRLRLRRYENVDDVVDLEVVVIVS